MNIEEAKKEYNRIIDEYIEDNKERIQLKSYFPEAVRGAIYELDKKKRKSFQKKIMRY